MAWTGLVLTVEGRNALNRAQLSNTMNIKSIVVGDGKAPANFSTVRNLVHQLYEITAIKIDVTDGRCTVTADFPKVAYDYYFREIGIIVTTEDGDKLYVYDNCGDDAQYMVSSTGVETTKKRIRLSLAISDVEKITVSEPQILYVAYDDYENTIGRLDTNIKNTEEKLQKEISVELKRATKAEEKLAEDLTAETDRAAKAEDELQRRKLDIDGDASNVTVEFSEAEELKPMRSKIKMSELSGVLAKAVSSLIAHVANTNKVDNTADMDKPVSTAMQAALDSQYQQLTAYVGQKIADLVNGAPAALDTLKELADAITNHKSIMDALDTAIGKKANEAEFDSHVKDTTKHITATERTNWNDANSKKHTHSNKSVLDGITSTIVDGWNSAVTHISDAVKHITADERDKWNNGSHNYGKCDTAAGTAAKTVSCPGFKLATGAAITVKFSGTNTAANPTLNVNSTGAKPIYYRGAAITAGYLAANRTYTFRYNGTQWDLAGDIDTNTNTTYSDMKGATADAAGTHGLVPAPAAGAQGKFLRADGTWQTPTNTNNAVTQTNTSGADADYRVLLSNTADDTTRTEGARKATGLAYNIKNAILKVAKRLQVGNRAFLFEDSEGGNLQLVAPDDTVWEIDAIDGNLRIFTYANNGRSGIIINKLGQVTVPYGAWGTFNGEMYGAFVARGGEGGRGIHANANEFGIDLPPEEGYAGGLTWYQGTTPVGCIGYYKQGAYHYVGTDYANPTGSLKLGTLVGVNVYGGNNIHMWTDNEGGNLGLQAPDGTRWEMDAVDGNLRIFNYEPGIPGIIVSKNGLIHAKHGVLVGAQSYAFTIKENIITSPENAYLLFSTIGALKLCYGNNINTAKIQLMVSSDAGKIQIYSNSKSTNAVSIRPIDNAVGSFFLPNGGGTIAVTSSDIRLKKNVKDTNVKDALSIVNKIQFRQFDWKDSGRHQKIGVVADELERIDADMVMQGTGGYTKPDENGNREINPKCVDTFYLMGYYGKAIQELSEIIHNQQKTIDGLKKRIKRLENKK